MNTVDLSKAKTGDVVHFRCGGSSEIAFCERKYSVFDSSWFYQILFGASYHEIFYEENGLMDGELVNPFDIMKAEIK